MNHPLPVSLAFITDANQRVLITQRSQYSEMAGYWEFPGGKVEAKETSEEALKRELREELGIIVQAPRLITQLLHAYPRKTVLLDVYHVTEYSGVPRCCEKQQGMEWVDLENLSQYQLLEAGFRLIPYLSSVLNLAHESHHDA